MYRFQPSRSLLLVRLWLPRHLSRTFALNRSILSGATPIRFSRSSRKPRNLRSQTLPVPLLAAFTCSRRCSRRRRSGRWRRFGMDRESLRLTRLPHGFARRATQGGQRSEAERSGATGKAVAPEPPGPAPSRKLSPSPSAVPSPPSTNWESWLRPMQPANSQRTKAGTPTPGVSNCLTRAALSSRSSSSVLRPSALRSTGVTRLLRYYGLC